VPCGTKLPCHVFYFGLVESATDGVKKDFHY
jgi:hypothetical protein